MLRVPSFRRALSALTLLWLAGCDAGDLPPEVPWLDATTYESHEPYFPIASGKHEGIDCDKCHGDFETFSKFTCISCHLHSAEQTDPAHSQVPGYTYTETSCFDCHPRGEVDGAGPEHERIFPIAAPSAHETVACADCHPDRANREVVTCVDCHAHEASPSEAEHTLVGGYRYATSDCLKCHFDSKVPRVAEHVPFRIDVEASHAPSAAECLECHTAELPDRPFPSADFGKFECTGCHLRPQMDPAHGGISDYRYESGACFTCHSNGEGGGISREAHDMIFLVSTGAHADTECGGCHMDASDFEVVNCVGCHPHEQAASLSAHAEVGGYRFASSTCLDCHADRPVFRVRDHQPFRIDRRAEHAPREAECLECHASKDPSRQFVTAAFDNFDCTVCHERREMDEEHEDERRYRYDPLTCVMSGCHPDGQEPDDDDDDDDD